MDIYKYHWREGTPKDQLVAYKLVANGSWVKTGEQDLANEVSAAMATEIGDLITFDPTLATAAP